MPFTPTALANLLSLPPRSPAPAVAAGDVVVFRPGSVHGIDNGTALGRMYCLEVMLPNEQFAEFVRSGTDTGQLGQDDLCVLASVGCR